jgi:ribosomal protein L11 methyltransferase
VRRVSVRVPIAQAEEARALMLELVPEGFEERERGDDLELAAYTDAHGGARIARAFHVVSEHDVDADWASRWRTFHRPVRAGPFWVGPSWEGKPDDALAIVIDPGLAFGTGAHATTRLCLEFLAGLRRGSLLDAGCGSGVLAVAAAKLGFDPVYGIDDDPCAAVAARDNAERNRAEIDVTVADLVHARLPATDSVVANIAVDVIERLAPRLRDCDLVTSGYLERDAPRLPRAEHVERRVVDGWAADRFRLV